ncbi:Protein N-terminal amidase [Ceratocystis lukuohia]|uniref:Protein N-terminal amidase n=1 Tax=Ceratocystis lukuohia TaxID=2019550 RepID=A0ABR4M940_9PEZI
MKIGCLQFAAGQDGAGQNLARADSILLHANPEELDLLVLPELAFVGQVFDSLSGIYPHLESSGSGITSSWARAVALKYNCTVMVGYAEKADIYPKRASGPKCYNSTIAIDADGEIVAHYRKRYLQPSEETWASEGPGSFHKGWLPHLGQVAIGTSMDINPYKFQDRWDNFDFAFHVMKIQANLVVVTMAWPTHEDPRSFNRTPLEPDANTLMYWISRLEPIIRAENEKEVIVVFCNKSGSEGHACYAGTSAVLGISAGEVRVYNILGRGTHGLLVADTDSPPLGRLVRSSNASAEKDREAQAKVFLRFGVPGFIKPGHDALHPAEPTAEIKIHLDTKNTDLSHYSRAEIKRGKGRHNSSKRTAIASPHKVRPTLPSSNAEACRRADLSNISLGLSSLPAPSLSGQSFKSISSTSPISSISQGRKVSLLAQSSSANHQNIPTSLVLNNDMLQCPRPIILWGHHICTVIDTPTTNSSIASLNTRELAAFCGSEVGS